MAAKASQLLLFCHRIRNPSGAPPVPFLKTLTRFSAAAARRSSSTSSSSDGSSSGSSSDGSSSDASSDLRDRIFLLTEKQVCGGDEKEELRSSVSALAHELLALPDSSDLASALESSTFASLLQRTPRGFASVELLALLKSHPLLALEVFNWRRKQAETGIPMISEEYSKAITLAGRTKNLELAEGLFSEAISAGIVEPSLYNSLMAAFMYNGLTKKAVLVFESLKQDPMCKPNIVSYNILLSIFGRSMLVDHMEAVLRAVDEAELSYTITTYNTLIAAYITAWMWEKMESTFQCMEQGPVRPDEDTLLLMLRGYAHSGNLEKMERTYELVKEIVNNRKVPLLRAMICAYSKSSDHERVRKIEALLKHIPEDDYRPWLNVLLIRVYAQEGLVEAMEGFISQAFQRQTTVTTVGVMRSIISGYFKSDAVDRLAGFIRKAEYAEWRICRSLYHCKMVMYGKQNRFGEMHGVLDEMESYRLSPTHRTFLIMYKAYNSIGRRSEAETVIGMMWKHGFGSPEDGVLL